MFNGIVLYKQTESGAALDAGMLAEALLFYPKVTVLLDYPNALSLIGALGPDVFFDLIENRYVEVIYSRSQLGTQSDIIHGVTQHSVVQFSFMGTSRPKAGERKLSHVKAMLERAGVPRFRVKEFYRRFVKCVGFRDIEDWFPEGQECNKFICDDRLSKELFRESARKIVEYYAPSYKLNSEFVFSAHGGDRKFFISDNINYEELNYHVQKNAQKDIGIFTPQRIAQHIFSATKDLTLGATLGFDISTGEISRKVNELRVENLYRNLTRDTHTVRLFQEKIISSVCNIREAINSGERDFKDIIPLIDRAERFKSWLGELDNNADLIDEYLQEVSRLGWAEQLPGKSVRFSFIAGAGLLADIALPGGIGTALGVTLSALDSFYLDKIYRGWRPDTFVSDFKNTLPTHK